MISLLQRLSVPSNAAPDVQNLCVQFNNHLNELELHLASLKGSDGQQASSGSDIDMQGKRIINTGAPQTTDDAISLNTLRQTRTYRSSLRRTLTANLKVAAPTNLAAATSMMNQAAVKNLVATAAAITIANAWPIGSIFLSAVSTNPATLLGFGAWSQIAQGQFIVGYSSGDPDFGTVMASGGNKNHTHAVDPAATTSGTPSSVTSVGGAGTDVASATHTHSTDIGSTTSGNNSTLPPFYVVYLWRRTA